MPNYLTRTRQSLYHLVWSTPMTKLAKDFGISDVALAMRCHAVDVPVPPRDGVGEEGGRAGSASNPAREIPHARSSGIGARGTG